MPSSRRSPAPLPKVAVLLATHNGRRYLPEQMQSILEQRGVEVRVIALDDGSTDDTVEWLTDLATREPRVSVLELQGRAGSAAANFYRLVRHAVTSPDELVAFADQDDVWMPDKLATHAALLARGHDGVSSNVTSFTADGKREEVLKAFPQREFDYLLESPGPGNTFLMTRRLVDLTRDVLDDLPGVADAVEYHDSLIYAIARAHGWSWHIDPVSSVDYRQHDANVMGSNVGLASALERFRLIRTHWLRNHSTLLTRVAVSVAPDETRAAHQRILGLLTGRGIRNRLQLARLAPKLRRRPRDQRIIGFLITIGIW